jgi:hypothetical protein
MTADNRFAMPWALDDRTPEPAEVIDLTHAVHEAGRGSHCPACQGTDIDLATTPDGRRYERCLGCDRLWAVDDHDRRRLVPRQHHKK